VPGGDVRLGLLGLDYGLDGRRGRGEQPVCYKVLDIVPDSGRESETRTLFFHGVNGDEEAGGRSENDDGQYVHHERHSDLVPRAVPQHDPKLQHALWQRTGRRDGDHHSD
jgi:hypothetical protein